MADVSAAAAAKQAREEELGGLMMMVVAAALVAGIAVGVAVHADPYMGMLARVVRFALVFVGYPIVGAVCLMLLEVLEKIPTPGFTGHYRRDIRITIVCIWPVAVIVFFVVLFPRIVIQRL